MNVIARIDITNPSSEIAPPPMPTARTLIALRANLDSGGVHSTLRDYERTQTELWFRIEVPVDPDVATSNYVAYTMLGKIATWELNAPMDELKTIRVVVLQTGSLFFQNEMASLLPALS